MFRVPLPMNTSVPAWTLVRCFELAIQPRETRSFVKSRMLNETLVAFCART